MIDSSMRARAVRRARTVAVLFALAALTACGGSKTTSYTPPGGNVCNPGTDIALANPTSNATGVSTGIGQLTIVANGSANVLNGNTSLFALQIQSNAGEVIAGATLRPVEGTSYQHPYASDFYYASSVPSLPSQRSWTAYLVEPGSTCTPFLIGVFST